MIKLKRVYEKPEAKDGQRILVERLWPRGIRKSALHLDLWSKDAGPSTALRRWFSHDPAKWDAFRRRYFAELDSRPEAWAPLARAVSSGQVTFLFSSHDEVHNNAVALKQYLERKKGRK